MGETVRIEIPRELYEALKTLATNREEKPERLVAEALRWYVDSEAEFLEAVEEGIAAADAGEVVSHEEFLADIERRLKRSK